MSKRCCVLAFLLFTSAIVFTHAQKAASDTPNFAGTWLLDPLLTDNPEQVAAALRIDAGQFGPAGETAGGGSGTGGSGGGRRGGFGGRRGGGGSGGRGGAAANPVSTEDRQRLDDLTEGLRFPSSTLTIAQTDAEITMQAAAGAVETIHPNGKSEKVKLGSENIEQKAVWEGPHLDVSYPAGHGTLTYTYLLDPVSRQLVVKANFAREHELPGPFTIKLVYNPAPAK